MTTILLHILKFQVARYLSLQAGLAARQLTAVVAYCILGSLCSDVPARLLAHVHHVWAAL